MRLALEAMAGDPGPEPIVAAAVEALRAESTLSITLLGPVDQLNPLLPSGPPRLRERIETFPTSQYITREEDATQALRIKPDASVARCWQLLAERKADAIICQSPANVVVTAGTRLRRYLPNVRRPGLLAALPCQRGTFLLIDAGTNPKPDAAHLYQHGLMAWLYARTLLRKDRPTLGLLHSGSTLPDDPRSPSSGQLQEEGPGLYREALALFEQSPLKPYYTGTIVARDLFQSAPDIVVCGAALGSMTLELSKSVMRFVETMPGPARATEETSPVVIQTKLMPFLGIEGICLVLAGSATQTVVRDAIQLVSRWSEMGLNEVLTRELEAGPLSPGGPLA